jgi:hypothetical protein
MSSCRSRQITAVLAGFAVAAGSLFISGSALADTALFRIEQKWHNFPGPPVTSPGGAGLYEGYIIPYVTKSQMGGYLYPAATASVAPGNPVGAAFTLPTGFFTYQGTFMITPKTGWPGYTTITYVDYYNGPGKFQPNNTTGPTRIVFPTTGGNPVPNYGLGNPQTPTTTFSGRYDGSRAGSINVTPGPRRFGGTYRLFYGPNAGFYQYVYYFAPAYYKQYGYYHCFQNGVFDCTKSTFVSHIGDTTAIYQIRAFLLNVKGTGTGNGVQSNTAKATTPLGYGGYPTPSGNVSFITRFQRYLNFIHPWTTGFASVQNPVGSPNIISPQAQGYDTNLGGADITVTRTGWNQQFNTDLSTVTTTTSTFKQYLYGVGRVVSLVRPRLIHTYAVPLNSEDPIINTWNVARMWEMKVFFVPEPRGMLLLGAGFAILLGVARMRRR